MVTYGHIVDFDRGRGKLDLVRLDSFEAKWTCLGRFGMDSVKGWMGPPRFHFLVSLDRLFPYQLNSCVHVLLGRLQC